MLWDKGTSYNDWIWRSNLFTLKGGNNWRLVRQTLNPIFTLSKMKVMYEVSIKMYAMLLIDVCGLKSFIFIMIHITVNV